MIQWCNSYPKIPNIRNQTLRMLARLDITYTAAELLCSETHCHTVLLWEPNITSKRNVCICVKLHSCWVCSKHTMRCDKGSQVEYPNERTHVMDSPSKHFPEQTHVHTHHNKQTLINKWSASRWTAHAALRTLCELRFVQHSCECFNYERTDLMKVLLCGPKSPAHSIQWCSHRSLPVIR